MFNSSHLTIVIVLCVLISTTHGDLMEYFNSMKSYFHQSAPEESADIDTYQPHIPYQVAEADEKFISQAIELTGVSPSTLDACQHRLILKLNSDCHNMNDIMLSKLAVGLLNCQSYIEGRKLYPCTEEMSLKECTSDMDSDIWTSYHLMTNRAKAVCYSIRQSQFRGLTEHTVNRLMSAAQHQMHSLTEIARDQDELQKVAQRTLDSMTQGHADLSQQQKDLQQAQLYGQMQLEDNISKLADEKKMIVDAQKQIATMTKSVQDKLNDAAQQIEKQSANTHSNHQEILQDLLAIHEKTQSIFQRMEDSSKMLLARNGLANKQYETTLMQLVEMNKTVHALISLVGDTKQALEGHLSWISTALGGTDDAIDRLYTIVSHSLFLLIGMISCAFISANTTTRLIVVSIIPANLAITLSNCQYAADLTSLAVGLVACVTIQSLVLLAWKCYTQRSTSIHAVPDKNSINSLTLQSHTPTSSIDNSALNAEVSRITGSVSDIDSRNSTPLGDIFIATPPAFDKRPEDSFKVYFSPTPPRSRINYRSASSNSSVNSSPKVYCNAITRLRTPCKNPVANGKDVCYRHKKGDSVLQ